jgi:hypothetical protein
LSVLVLGDDAAAAQILDAVTDQVAGLVRE